MYRSGQKINISKVDEKLYKSFIETLQGSNYDKEGLVTDSDLADIIVHNPTPVVISNIHDGEILWYNAAYSNLAYEQGYRMKDVRNFAALKEFLKDTLYLDINMDLFVDDPANNKFKYVRDLVRHRLSQDHTEFEVFSDWMSHIKDNGQTPLTLRTVYINFKQEIYIVTFADFEKFINMMPERYLEIALHNMYQKDPG